MWLLKQLENGQLFPGCGLGCLAKQPRLKALLDISMNPNTKGTVFFPGDERAFKRHAETLCLTLEEYVRAMNETEEVAAKYINAVFHSTTTLYLKDFKEGMSLTTMQGLNFTLHRARNRWGAACMMTIQLWCCACCCWRCRHGWQPALRSRSSCSSSSWLTVSFAGGPENTTRLPQVAPAHHG